MCGICGVFGRSDRRRLKEMTDCVKHRGPDSEGFYVDSSCGLGARRLAIVDGEKGQQPVENERGNLQIVFNGEIYNYQVLREELRDKGHRFSTDSDTEVVVHGFEEWGKGVLDRLNGMFAFAVYNSKDCSLFLARDRLGIKPLFYCDNSDFLFASQIKSLVQDNSVSKSLDWKGISYYLYYKYFPDPFTPLKDVKSLPPGHFAEFKNGELNVERYWSFEGFENSKSLAGNAQIVGDLLEDSVEKRLMGERSVGAFLSGGLDSTAITALMDSLKSGEVRTYSVGFSKDDRDMNYARKVSQVLGTNHKEFLVEEDSLDLLPEIVGYMDMPVGDPAALPTYILSQKAGKDSTVILTGEGSDELFGGYPEYRYMEVLDRARKIPETLRNKGAKLAGYVPDQRISRRGETVIGSLDDPEKAVFELKKVFNEEEVEQIVENAASEKEAVKVLRRNSRDKGNIADRMMDYDTRVWLPGNLLAKVDRMTMAHSIEARLPFLDHRLVEKAKKIPLKQKISLNNEKKVLKKAVKRYVPKKVVERRKHGFNVPVSNWVQEDQKRIKKLFETDKTVLNYPENLHENLDGLYDQRKLTAVLILEIWLEQLFQTN